MALSGVFTFAQIGERWPDALVLWDRDVAGQGWTPVFRGYEPRGNLWKLSAFDITCRHATTGDDGEGVVWSACRCVTWNGEAWVTLAAERYDSVRCALRGEHFALDLNTSHMLWAMLIRGCAAEVTPSSFIVPYIFSGRSDEYDLGRAPGIISFLLDGVGLPESGHSIRPIHFTGRLDRAHVPMLDPGAARYVRFDDDGRRVVFRIRDSEEALLHLGPQLPVIDPLRFVVVGRPCPYCGETPDRYRVLRDGFHVCMACGRSLPPL